MYIYVLYLNCTKSKQNKIITFIFNSNSVNYYITLFKIIYNLIISIYIIIYLGISKLKFFF